MVLNPKAASHMYLTEDHPLSSLCPGCVCQTAGFFRMQPVPLPLSGGKSTPSAVRPSCDTGLGITVNRVAVDILCSFLCVFIA